jgi:hypothetical protein
MPTAVTDETILVTSAPTMEGALFLAADYPFMGIFWSMAVFFLWVIWIWLLILVLTDNFRRRDHSGWAKAFWTIFVIFLPLLGVIVYMIARPPEEQRLGAAAP